MKTRALPFFVIAIITFVTSPSLGQAADCAAQARNVAAQDNAEVLSVSDQGNGQCEATFRIPGQNGKPPRVVTKSFKG
ncbi:MAG: hypothetical protein WBC71_04640 [Salaquimonas sp.]